MKKTTLLGCGIMLGFTTLFAQSKPKSMKMLRDSIFTEMKLSDESRKKMHENIENTGKASKAVNTDTSMSEEQKKKNYPI